MSDRSARTLPEGASKTMLNTIFLVITAGFVAVTAGLLFLNRFLQSLPGWNAGLSTPIVILSVGLEVLMYVPFVVYLRKRHFKVLPFARFTHPGAAGGWLAVACGVSMFFANIALVNVFTPLFQLAGIAPLPTERLPALPSAEIWQLALTFLVLIAIIASMPAIIEEFIFRGVLFRTLGSSWRTVFITGMLFALMHLDAVTLPSKLAMGFALGAAVLLTRSVWTSSIMHYTNNALALITAFLIPAPSIRAASWPISVAIWALVALFSGAVVVGLLFAMKKTADRREVKVLVLQESGQAFGQLGFISAYVEPPLADSRRVPARIRLPLWISSGVLASALIAAALADLLRWWG